MTIDEFNKIKQKTGFTAFMSCRDDPTENLFREIYFAGHNDGFRFAIKMLQHLDNIPMAPDMDMFFARNLSKMMERMEAINELNSEEA